MKKVSFLISLLFILSICTAQSDSSYYLQIHAPAKIQTYTGITTSITISVGLDKCAAVQRYLWDMYNDMTTIVSTTTNTVSFNYTQSGTYKMKVTVLTGDNKTTSAVISMVVLDGIGTQQILPRDPVTFSTLKSSIDRAGDGIRTKYAIIVNGADETSTSSSMSLWTIPRVQKIDSILLSKGYNRNNIYYLNGKNADPTNHEMDDVANMTTFMNAYHNLMTKIDADDFLFLWIDDHGIGYYNPDYNLLDYQLSLDKRNYSGRVEFGSNLARINLQKNEYMEKNFKLKVFNDTPLPLTGIDSTEKVVNIRFAGLNKWFLMQSAQYIDPITKKRSKKLYRAKYVSHINATRPDGTTVIDSDPYIELVVDFLKIDADRDGVIQATGTSFTSSNDGSDAYLLRKLPNGALEDNLIDITDETKWQQYYTIVQDNIHDAAYQQMILFDGSNEITKSYILFDAGMDDQLDIDIVPLGINPGNIALSQLHVDGTDSNNDGLIDGVDFNEDGNLNESMGVDQSVSLCGDALFGSELKNMLNTMPCTEMIIGIMSCNSGGFIADLSKKGRIVMTSTNNGALGYSNDGDHFTRAFNKNSAGFELADVNNDGNVTMVELFNFARSMSCLTYHLPQYDDNGDGLSQQQTITGTVNGDGCIGSRMTLNGWIDSQQNIVGTIYRTTTKDATVVNITNSTISNNCTVQVHSKESTLTNVQVNVGSTLLIDNNVCH